ncbi:pentapeptide repeat-containing protein [Acinetobacter oleivorans]|uniref:pentapeptide repeat-containing protein n=1 Tax=Acinetobacter oleivorans TaxID=1148157 RepID=UPI001CD602FF|nr:pentapeptide repeat-containing protein [Acinetobacter oleivorans]
MSLEGKNKKPFSYISKEVLSKNFQNKDFNKTSSYYSNFSHSKFENTSFLATKFKWCTFYEATFKNCTITGAHFKKCNLENFSFEGCVIRASVFESCKMNGISFKNCYIELDQFKKYPDLDLSTCYTKPLTLSIFSQKLLDVVESLRSNDFIRRSMVLLIKKNRINLIALKKLVDKFGEEMLIKSLPLLPNIIKNQFYTLSYLEKILSDLETSSNI